MSSGLGEMDDVGPGFPDEFLGSPRKYVRRSRIDEARYAFSFLPQTPDWRTRGRPRCGGSSPSGASTALTRWPNISAEATWREKSADAHQLVSVSVRGVYDSCHPNSGLLASDRPRGSGTACHVGDASRRAINVPA